VELIISSALFLLVSILGYSFYLKFITENTINENRDALDRNVLMAEKGQEIIEKALDRKISYEDSQKELTLHFKDVEENVLRKKKIISKNKISKEIIIAHVSNWLFIIGVLLMVVSFSSYLLCKI